MITSMLFYPDRVFYEKPQDYGLVYEDVSLHPAEGVTLHAWYLPAANEEGTVLFLHGNAGNISNRLSKADGWVKRGFSVLLLDYRGYGNSTGEIKRGDDIVTDAETALDWLLKEKQKDLARLVFYGESLGSHPALRLAAKHKAAAVILEAPYTSFVELAKIHYGLIPHPIAQQLLKDFSFPNLDVVGDIKIPLFILHGTEDETCPYEMSGRLMDAAPEPKTFFSIPGGTHNDLPVRAGADYWDKPRQFANKYIPA